MTKPSITSLTLRFPTRRLPRPTTLIPPLPNLITLVVYDIDPLCSPDDISLVLLHAKKLENLKMHFSPRMRETGEESVNILNYFGRCIAAKHAVPAKRIALYNLYARNSGDGFENCTDQTAAEEITIINCMGSSDPMTVFLDDTWRVNNQQPVPPNLKMMRGDIIDKDHVSMLARFYGLERLYLLSKHRGSKPSSMAATPDTPTVAGTPFQNGTSTASGTPLGDQQCKGLAADYLAVIQSNHRTMRHLLLSDQWQLSDDVVFKLCQNCPDLEQLGFSCNVPPMDSLRQILGLVPKLWALRILVRQGSELSEKIDGMEAEMHQFALATEVWKPEYSNLKYISIGEKFIFKLGNVIYPPKGRNGVPAGQENSMNARRMGPMRRLTRIDFEDIKHVEIWGLDTTEFDPKFP